MSSSDECATSPEDVKSACVVEEKIAETDKNLEVVAKKLEENLDLENDAKKEDVSLLTTGPSGSSSTAPELPQTSSDDLTSFPDKKSLEEKGEPLSLPKESEIEEVKEEVNEEVIGVKEQEEGKASQPPQNTPLVQYISKSHSLSDCNRFLDLPSFKHWEVIRQAFSQHIENVDQLITAMEASSYPSKSVGTLNILRVALLQAQSDPLFPGAKFFESTLPTIIKYALKASEHSDPIPLLSSSNHGVLKITQRYATSLLSCMFLGILPSAPLSADDSHNNSPKNSPKKNGPKEGQDNTTPDKKKGMARDFEDKPFHQDFVYLLNGTEQKQVAKLQFYIHFFERVADMEAALDKAQAQGNGDQALPEVLPGFFYVRRVGVTNDSTQENYWSSSTTPLCEMHIYPNGCIEDADDSHLQIDFANKYIGGGVLNTGAVQEEIRFALAPLFTVSLLICTVMREHEAILMTGPQRYSSYKGYGRSLQYGGDFVDPTPRDEDGTIKCCFVGIDAVHFHQGMDQYHPKYLLRDVVKAYAGFKRYEEAIECLSFSKISSGNWGCGAFGGDKHLKSILQWMAASEAGRPLRYYSFNEGEPVSPRV